MVSAADNSPEMKNYRNSSNSSYGLRTPTPQHNNMARSSSSRLAGAEIDQSLRRPINQLIRAENAPPTTSNRLISIGGSSGNEEEVGVKEYLVLMGNRKWIQEKNFIEIPSDVEAKLAQQEALVNTHYQVHTSVFPGFPHFQSGELSDYCRLDPNSEHSI